MRRALALLGVIVLLLTGCEAPAVYGPSPTPTTPPIFASEEEALNAAKDLLDGYMVAISEFGRGGGSDPGLLIPFTTDRMLEDELDFWTDNPEVESLVGEYTYSHFDLQLLDQNEPGIAYVQAYVCLTFSGVRVTKDGSDDVASIPRPVEALFETDEGDLRLDNFRPWTGRNFCEQ